MPFGDSFLAPFFMSLIPRQQVIFLSLQIRLYFLNYYVSGIIQDLLFYLTSFIQDNYFEIYSDCCMYQQFIPYYFSVVLHCMDVPQSAYTFTS